MVTDQQKEERSVLSAVEPLKPTCPPLSIDELERRMEMTVLRAGWLSPASAHTVTARDGAPCTCLGVLCDCDGQDCAGICESHCLINYR